MKMATRYPGAHVSALREAYNDGKRTLQTEESVPTNDRGEYRLFGLRPGRYLIAAIYHPGAVPNANDIDHDALEVDHLTESYVRTFYPGSTDTGKAEAVSVKAGEEIPSMDFLLRPTSVYRVKGRVFNTLAADRKKSNQAMVYLTPRNSRVYTDSIALGPDNVVKANGTFDLPAVPPGSYVVNAEWSDDGKRNIARQNIEIGDADVEGLLLTIAKGPTVAGHVHWDGSSAAQADDDMSIRAGDPEDEFSTTYARVESGGLTRLMTVTPSVYGNARVSYDLGGALPAVGLASQVTGRRLADFAQDPGVTGLRYAPPTIDLRLTATGRIPRLAALQYRISADFGFTTVNPYGAAGGSDASNPDLVPVVRATVLFGLQYGF